MPMGLAWRVPHYTAVTPLVSFAPLPPVGVVEADLIAREASLHAELSAIAELRVATAAVAEEVARRERAPDARAAIRC